MFSIRLKDLRERAGYSQYTFADKFGVAQSTVGNWEAGKREPNFETTVRLAKFFGVTIDYLLGLSDNPTPIKPSAEDLAALDEYAADAKTVTEDQLISALPPKMREAVKLLIRAELAKKEMEK